MSIFINGLPKTGITAIGHSPLHGRRNVFGRERATWESSGIYFRGCVFLRRRGIFARF